MCLRVRQLALAIYSFISILVSLIFSNNGLNMNDDILTKYETFKFCIYLDRRFLKWCQKKTYRQYSQKFGRPNLFVLFFR